MAQALGATRKALESERKTSFGYWVTSEDFQQDSELSKVFANEGDERLTLARAESSAGTRRQPGNQDLDPFIRELGR